MPSLESLPVDLKFLLLTSITDVDTLVSLLLASRSYNDIFREYKPAIVHSTWMNESARHARESYFVAAFSSKLRDTEATKDEVQSILTQYLESTRGDCTWAYRNDDNKIHLSEEVLMRNHKSLRRLCKFFVANEMHPRLIPPSPEEQSPNQQQKPATATEKERIISALYRLWVCLLLLATRHGRDEEGHWDSWTLPERTVAELFSTWTFWDFMAVKRMKDFFFDQLVPLARLSREQQWLLDYYERSRPMSLSEHAVTQYFFIMSYDFPHNIERWLQGDVDPEGLLNRLDILYHESIHRPENYRVPTFSPDFSRLFKDYLDGELWFPTRYDEALWPDTPPIRICRPGHEPFPIEEKTKIKSWTRPFPHRNLNDIDLKACIWDDWRLASWGYVFPEFGPEIIYWNNYGHQVKLSYEKPVPARYRKVDPGNYGHDELDGRPIPDWDSE
ncbi:hypothetical protein ABW19_dt0201146 [Dactylella cylindrospora]|nr:hypothetical protein ABW19_dt0201146 [Dactylella cylindrospora]